MAENNIHIRNITYMLYWDIQVHKQQKIHVQKFKTYIFEHSSLSKVIFYRQT